MSIYPRIKRLQSILISCGARLAPFDIAELRELTSYDEMELDMLGDQRTAMFVIISDTDDTFNFIVAMMYMEEGFPITSGFWLMS